jgi:ferredoxin-NADP reductase
MAVEYEARLDRIVDHGCDTRSLFFRLATPLHFLPGQFISCLLPAGDARLTRPYSIASDPESPDLIEILLNLVPNGPGSHHLFSLRPGATVRYTGPWGTFTLESAPAVETVLVANGTGIAPIRPMLRRALDTVVRPITLVYGLPASTATPYLEEFTAPRPNFTLLSVPSARLVETVERRFVTADTDRSRHFYCCGVGPVIHTLRDRLRAAGYERRAVRYEQW